MPKSLANTSDRSDRILAQMAALKIRESDLQEVFVASPGPGGQNVNKVATCVVLKHVPSDTVIKCSQYRTQLANRVRARELLVQQLEEARQQQRQQRRTAQYKERARRRKRSAKSKEKMLENKRQQSKKKQSRRKISMNDL